MVYAAITYENGQSSGICYLEKQFTRPKMLYFQWKTIHFTDEKEGLLTHKLHVASSALKSAAHWMEKDCIMLNRCDLLKADIKPQHAIRPITSTWCAHQSSCVQYLSHHSIPYTNVFDPRKASNSPILNS